MYKGTKELNKAETEERIRLLNLASYPNQKLLRQLNIHLDALKLDWLRVEEQKMEDRRNELDQLYKETNKRKKEIKTRDKQEIDDEGYARRLQAKFDDEPKVNNEKARKQKAKDKAVDDDYKPVTGGRRCCP